MSPFIEGASEYQYYGTPSAGTSEVQTLTIGGSPTGGTFKLTFDTYTTEAITWSSTNTTLRDRVDAALEALPNIGTGGVTVAVGVMTNGVGTLTITFAGNLARLAVPTITVADNSLVDATPPTIAVEETTPGDDDPPTNEVQTLTIAAGPPTGGTFKLEYDGQVTADITWSATNNTLRDNVDAALEALSNIGAGEVTTAVGTMTGGVGTLTITFSGTLGNLDVPLITVEENALTPTTQTVTVAETTPGVTATMRGAPTGAILQDTENGVLYINTGTALAPTWTVVGAQT